jgi:hypothetical protein
MKSLEFHFSFVLKESCKIVRLNFRFGIHYVPNMFAISHRQTSMDFHLMQVWINVCQSINDTDIALHIDVNCFCCCRLQCTLTSIEKYFKYDLWIFIILHFILWTGFSSDNLFSITRAYIKLPVDLDPYKPNLNSYEEISLDLKYKILLQSVQKFYG